jgi:ribosomal-protein-alanine N-acetyltransferase
VSDALIALTADDSSALAALHATCFESPWTADAFASLFASNAVGWGFYAADSSSLVAFMMLRIAADEAEILTLATHPDYRKQGLALRLLTAIHPLLQAQAVEQIFLEVRVDNTAAAALYAKAGYQRIALRPRYYTLADGRQMDAEVWRIEVH